MQDDLERTADLASRDQVDIEVGEDSRVVAEGLREALAFDQSAAYENPNFEWFRNRFERFIYIDRVVVAPAMRGRGLARALYSALFSRAASLKYSQVVCEVNLDPPNPASDAFHASLGFEQVGLAVLPRAGKTVRYFSRKIG